MLIEIFPRTPKAHSNHSIFIQTFAPQVQMSWNQARAPLLIDSFPKTLITQSNASRFSGYHNYKTKQNKLPTYLHRWISHWSSPTKCHSIFATKTIFSFNLFYYIKYSIMCCCALCWFTTMINAIVLKHIFSPLRALQLVMVYVANFCLWELFFTFCTLSTNPSLPHPQKNIIPFLQVLLWSTIIPIQTYIFLTVNELINMHEERGIERGVRWGKKDW